MEIHPEHPDQTPSAQRGWLRSLQIIQTAFYQHTTLLISERERELEKQSQDILSSDGRFLWYIIPELDELDDEEEEEDEEEEDERRVGEVGPDEDAEEEVDPPDLVGMQMAGEDMVWLSI